MTSTSQTLPGNLGNQRLCLTYFVEVSPSRSGLQLVANGVTMKRDLIGVLEIASHSGEHQGRLNEQEGQPCCVLSISPGDLLHAMTL